MKRWVVLAAGVLMQSLLGGIYAWSAFVPSLSQTYGLSRGRSGLIFGVMIGVFTVAMIPAGRLLQQRGPRLTASIGACLFAAGYIGASYSGGDYSLLLVSLGVVSGAGIGFGYVCPLTVGMKWFPNHKGLVTGISVAGFGGGSILFSFVIEHLLTTLRMPVLEVFRLLGAGLGGVALLSALLLSQPRAPAAEERGKTSPVNFAVPSKGHFWLICAGMLSGTFAGLLTVGNLKPLVLSLGLPAGQAALAISLFAAGNAAGRVLWGQVHDRLRSRKTILLSLAFLAFSLLLYLGNNPPGTAILLAAVLTGLGFGACFVVYASAIVELYGVESFPRLYPLCFLGYGVAGLTGPSLGGWMADARGSYDLAVSVSASIVGLAFVLILLRFHPCSPQAQPQEPAGSVMRVVATSNGPARDS